METTLSETRAGWTKPQRKPTLPELLELIATKRAELQLLESEASALQLDAKLNAVAQVRNIMRAHELTLADVLDDDTTGPRRTTR